MKKITLVLPLAFAFCALHAFAQQTVTYNVAKLAKSEGLKVFNRELQTISENGREGIRLSKDSDEGVAWILGVEFSEGIVEFDVRGENVKQHSFVGLAFHGQNDSTFDAIYLRPFNFFAEDETARSHGIQYVAFPNPAFHWRSLRENFPNQYEQFVEPAPDPNSWIRMRIVIKDGTISTYLNGRNEPALVVKKLTTTKSGKLGFYVADTSGGDFANLTITKTN